MVDGQWPWERGEMETQPPLEEAAPKDDFLYRLPRIKDPRTGKVRAMTAQEMMKKNAQQEPEVSPHDW